MFLAYLQHKRGVVVFILVTLATVLPGSAEVNLVATDENGEQTNHLLPGTTVNLNCSYDVDPLYLNFYNGTDKNIFVWNFETSVQSIGSGFQNLAKFNDSGDGWMSIKFKVPYCYKDEVIKCTVLDQAAEKHENKKEFPIGTIQKPSKIGEISCDGETTIKEGKVSFTCQVFGNQPEVSFDWSAGCTASHPVSTEDTTKCFFNQTSTCQMDLNEGENRISCSVKNDIGEESCKITVIHSGSTSNRLSRHGRHFALLIFSLLLSWWIPW